jgi:hypothetical protein
VNDEVDRQLETLTLLAANLYYQGTPPSMFKADRSTFEFIARLVATDESRTIRATLVEILHRMSLVPGEQRKAFANKETLLILLQFIYLDDHYEVQVRSFEALYFLTSGALNVEVWEEYSVVRQMIDAADARKKKS